MVAGFVFARTVDDYGSLWMQRMEEVERDVEIAKGTISLFSTVISSGIRY